MQTVPLLVLLLLVLSAVLYRRLWSKHNLLPPGPPVRFLTGNLHHRPTSQPWLTYADWSKQYGPVVTLRTFHKTEIILNSARSALDLLDARSVVYSDRPVSWMSGRIIARSTMFQLSSMDARFPQYRRMLLAGLNRRATQRYRAAQEQQLTVLLRGLAKDPEAFLALIQTYVAAIALRIAYGYQVSAEKDRFVTLIESASRAIIALRQSPFYFELFPFLRFLPSWFPLAEFKRAVAKHKPVMDAMVSVPFNWAKTKIESGSHEESFFSHHFRPDESVGDVPQGEEEREILKWTAAAIYVGGAHTTTSAIASFFLLMSTHPAAQQTAQAEIDRIVGNGRLLTLDDQKHLPYVTAVLKETLRWAPVAPLGLPHKVTRDDIYDGYLIPKGTTVIANIWAITHDPEVCPNPFVFDPARHLGETPQRDPFDFVFGYGRRVCPGATLAEESLFLAIANILAAFSIAKAHDAEGKEVEPNVEWRTATVTFPTNLRCLIVPRSPDMLASITM